MAISPPSDILLDVANAADPAKVRLATNRLAKLAADPAATNEEFGKALVAARADTGKETPAVSPPLSSAATAHLTVNRAPQGKDVYQKFEAVLLQNFVESMLPKDDDLFGDKNSAGAYRSMMAEQLATQLAKAGGIGIAKTIEKAHPHLAPASPAGSA